MDQSDSMFLLEIVAEELKSYINCRDFGIKSQFANIFSINLNNPNEVDPPLQKRPRKRKHKTIVRNSKLFCDRPKTKTTLQTGQSILFASNIDTLLSNMKQYPMELSLWSKIIPDYKIGSTQIPWSATFVDYLSKLHKKQGPPPLTVKGDYNVFDEFTSKRMAVITLSMKLNYLKALSEENQRSFSLTDYNNTPTRVLSTTKYKPINLAEETGIIKTIYSSRKTNIKKKTRDKKKHNKKASSPKEDSQNKPPTNFEVNNTEVKHEDKKFNGSIVTLVKSDTHIEKGKQICLMKSKSCTSVIKEKLNIFNYILGDNGPYGNQVYCVGYFTVENDFNDSPKGSPKESDKSSPKALISPPSTTVSSQSAPALPASHKSAEESENINASDKSKDTKKVFERYKFKICEHECLAKKADTEARTLSVCSLDLPQAASHLITVTKCKRVDCNNRSMRELPTPPDDRILLTLSDKKKDCCVSEQLEEIVGGMKAKMKFGEDPCFCECECRFGFTKRTTFCNICGGYETVGEDHARMPRRDMPFPCPIFHKLDKSKSAKALSEYDKSKSAKTLSELDKNKSAKALSGTSGSDSKKKKSDPSQTQTPKSIDTSSVKSKNYAPQSGYESLSNSKKGKKKKKSDDRFKFNYGYSAPQIGHSRCALPCSGTSGPIPKHMGWLWTAEDIPGLKFRPSWRPGAANKHVVRQLKIAKNPGEILSKKRKRVSGKPKRPLKRPLLIVQKKEGEYTVTMETMKTFTKPRTFNQYPYEDKPLVTYTIGRTEEENRERRKKKERSRRRLERLQRDFIQNAFRDMCEEICLKTYQQALGILPDAEKPDCTCYPADPGPDKTDLDHSCSCSEDKLLSSSDTDSDEWIVEFTPPNATFDPSYKAKKVTYADATTQYTYLDYKVKLLDRFGNPVPRFFKGPDGKQQCSDLGGFRGKDGKWLEINTDGYIGPDGKWAPNIFLGPNGEHVDAEEGKFQAMNNEWLVVGVDGYVDAHGKWKFYNKPKEAPATKQRMLGFQKKREKKEENAVEKPSEATWSCFGSVSPKMLSKMGIMGHGQDKKLLLSTLQDLLAQGEDITIPEPPLVPRSGRKGKMKRVSYDPTYGVGRKCKHAAPSDKGVVAVDGHGHKTYFRLKDVGNKRPRQRIATLTDQGISVSSFHVPCFHSFISSEVMKQQQLARLQALAKGANAKHKCTSTNEGGVDGDGQRPPPSMFQYRT